MNFSGKNIDQHFLCPQLQVGCFPYAETNVVLACLVWATPTFGISVKLTIPPLLMDTLTIPSHKETTWRGKCFTDFHSESCSVNYYNYLQMNQWPVNGVLMPSSSSPIVRHLAHYALTICVRRISASVVPSPCIKNDNILRTKKLGPHFNNRWLLSNQFPNTNHANSMVKTAVIMLKINSKFIVKQQL